MIQIKALVFANLKPKLSQPHFWEECEDDIHKPEMGTWESSGLPKLQSSIAGIKRPCLEAFFMSLEIY
jgi:hypothetical protein